MTQGQTPAGWYDDGFGQLRYFDGNGWTEFTAPIPPPQPAAPPPPPAAPPAAPPAQAPPAPPPAAPIQAQAPMAPAAPPAPGMPGGAPAAPPAAAPGYQTYQGDPVAAAAATGTTYGAPAGTTTAKTESVPFYRKRWFIPAAIVLLLVVLGGVFALSQGGDDDPGTTGTGTPTTGATGNAATGAFFGQPATAVATKATCTPSSAAPAPSVASTATGPKPTSSTSCTIGQITYTVVTWASQSDQDTPGALLNAFTQPVTAGTKYYATGAGWTAFDGGYTQAGAQDFATKAGGTAKGVVVVTS